MRILLSLSMSVWWAAACAAQTAPASAKSTLIGAVTGADLAGHRLSIKTDKGESAAVELDESTLYLRVPPGERNLKKAVRIAPAEISAGDRVLAVGRLNPDGKSILASSVIVMTKTDIARKQQQDREEWRRRGIAGHVIDIDAARQEFTLEVISREGKQKIVVEAGDHPEFRRYAPDSVRFSDARAGTFADLKVGDMVRALGDRSPDGSRFKPEQIVSGSFRNIAATVVSVNAAAGEIRVTDLDTKKPLTVKVDADSTLRRLSPMAAMMLARRVNPDFAAGGPPAGAARWRAQQGQGAGSARPAEPPAGASGAPGPRGPGRNMDFEQLLERMPALTLAELKPGDAVIIASTTGAEPSEVTAIKLVAGVEPLFTAAPRNAGPLGGMWNFGDIGMPE